MKRILGLMFIAVAVFCAFTAQGAPKAKARIAQVDSRNGHDSAGRKIIRLTIVTEQSKVPMWGTMLVCVAMKDKTGAEYYGEKTFRQPRRSGNDDLSADQWEFHIVTEGLTNATLSSYYIEYKNNANDEVLDTKTKNTKDPDVWRADNKKKASATVIAFSHRVLN